ncbi:MAG: porin family protein [Chitinophagales bacterium]|nr:PorT family protein [Bacteroidota bacterium]MCB9042616.1 PorT family protein [Chitinophagales bacterium]
MKKIILLFLLVGSCFPANAQFFRAGIVAGANFSQIDGDDASGFYKVGMNTGFTVSAMFNERWALAMDILYSQRGSANAFNADMYLDDFKIVTNYVEVPFAVQYHDRNGMIFGGGLSISRLLLSQFYQTGVPIDSYFQDRPAREMDYSAFLEFAYPLSNHLLAQLRYSYSVRSFQEGIYSVNRNSITGQYHKVVALRFAYIFQAIKEK